MNRELALRVLSQVMEWTAEEAQQEYSWLDLMSRVKYDAYRDFQAGMRFAESLARWLQQFAPEDRPAAYGFVKERLVFVGVAEMQRLVEQFYPRYAVARAAETIARRCRVPKWQVFVDPDLRSRMAKLQRRTLYMGLSDGARIDILRHANVGRLSNEQVLPTIQPSDDKWDDLLKGLREADGDPEARFETVYLIDDFIGTGTSLLRQKESGDWTGKLIRFFISARGRRNMVFSDDVELCVHHYIGSHNATDNLDRSLALASDELARWEWPMPHVTYGTTLPSDLPLDSERDSDFVRLTNKYYDEALETEHTLVGGHRHLGLGYGHCALPLVLEHNTPNNSVALLWGDTQGTSGTNAHPMQPLFRRRQRHI